MTTATHGAGIGAAAFAWQRLQALTGLAFAIFLLLHLGATLTAPLGEAAFARVQGLGRLLYQQPLIELALALTLGVHLVAGFMRARSGQRPPRVHGRRRLHRLAGWLLAMFIVGHVAATRGPGLLVDVDAGFDAVAFTLAFLPAAFVPYYYLLGLAGVVHGSFGSLTALHALGVSGAARWRDGGPFAVVVLVAAGWLALSLMAFGGRLFDIADPFAGAFARLYLSLLGAGG